MRYKTFPDYKSERMFDGRCMRHNQSVRDYFGLTQASRLLRHEFRPLYVVNMEVHVWLSVLKAFIDAFSLQTGMQRGTLVV